ncbi:MAG: fumarylacetoacetate hydrolase family protein [Burkholderiaceae bacterium]
MTDSTSQAGGKDRRVDPRIARAADWLVEQHQHRQPFTGFPSDCEPADIDEAYAVQDAFVALKARACGAPTGWKIALSNPAMQRFVGLDEAIAARVHGRQVVGSPARATVRDYGRLAVEFEIVAELGEDLPPRAQAYNRNSVAQAVRSIRPGLELIDDRRADYQSLKSHRLQLVADNAWNEGAVLGAPREDWRRLDLAELDGFVAINGQEIGAGSGRDLMGHPLEALAWLASHASRRGLTLRAGDFVLLGSLVTSKFPKRGEQIDFALEGFDPISLSLD